jgi:DNA mismatch repair protein MutL
MPDIIRLLSDKIANQIAAGEVIQRPASAIKELLENGIDAGSTKIDVVIKDAGRTLIQVIDNGCGMTETDARLSFERHATSKIKTADDLFNIKTKGFRGEALASIAAIAQVELKTKTFEADLGTSIQIEGSKVINQTPVSCAVGSNFSIKNLYFNVPARRNFLKSNAIETKHIIDEIERVALPHPDIHFTFHHNGNEVFNLPPGNLRQRIVSVFGKKFNERLVPVEEQTTIMNVTGYVVKPEFCKRTRGEQFFFVNNRFIKNSYLQHAVTRAYSELLSKDQFPSFFLFMEVDPAKIDINIHPTKTEVKFEDEKALYAIINSAVRNSLGKFNIAPSLDFNQENSFNVPPIPKDKMIVEPSINVDKNYNPFQPKLNLRGDYSNPFPANSSGSGNYKINISQNQVDANLEMLSQNQWEVNQKQMSANFTDESALERNSQSGITTGYDNSKTSQLHGKYIFTQVKKSLILIDQQRAHRQILFERFLKMMEQEKTMSQTILFPQTIELDNSSYALMMELLPEIKILGFDIENMGKNVFSVSGLPIGVQEENVKGILEDFIEQCKNNSASLKSNHKNELAWNLAKSSSIKSGKKLSIEEMSTLIDELFACQNTQYDYKGNKIIVTIGEDEIDEKFEK